MLATTEETMTLTDAIALLATGGRLTQEGSFRDQRAYAALMDAFDTNEFNKNVLAVRNPKGGMIFLILPKVGMGVTRYGWTDSHPYEVVKVVSDRCIEIRPMSAVIDPTWKMDITPGGFVGHVNNNGGKWILSRNPTAPTIRIRLSKHGVWKLKGEKFSVGQATKYHDYNF
jgi:hypothetical protein